MNKKDGVVEFQIYEEFSKEPPSWNDLKESSLSDFSLGSDNVLRVNFVKTTEEAILKIMDKLSNSSDLSKFRLKIPYLDLIEFEGKIKEDEDIKGDPTGYNFMHIEIPKRDDRKKITDGLKKMFGNKYYSSESNRAFIIRRWRVGIILSE